MTGAEAKAIVSNELHSQRGVILGSGTGVVFETADALVPEDIDGGRSDLYLKELSTDELTLLTPNAIGQDLNVWWQPGQSPWSLDTDTIVGWAKPSDPDRNILLAWVGETDTPRVLARNRGGYVGGFPEIEVSQDGSRAVFTTGAPLRPRDVDGRDDVYVVNLHTGAIHLLVDDHPWLWTGGAHISADGRTVVFESYWGVFVKDLRTRTMSKILPRDTDVADLSGDGGTVAYFADEVDPDGYDTYRLRLLDLATGAETDQSYAFDGEPLVCSIEAAALSYDGRYVAFESEDDRVVPWATDVKEGTSCVGNVYAKATDVFLRDVRTGATRLASPRANDATEPCPDWIDWDAENCEDAYLTGISADGRWVSFDSFAPNFPDAQGLRYDTYVAGPLFAVSG